jgi:hypothetical protein
MKSLSKAEQEKKIESREKNVTVKEERGWLDWVGSQ